MDNKNAIKQLADQIWATRVSRINAERRLVNKNSFIQGINIYYSCVTIIFSILSLINNDRRLSLITAFMTIAVLIAVLYLNSLKYNDIAREYRKNYTQLQKLELQLLDEEISKKQIEEIKKEYCRLLDSACNHITFDYYCTVAGSNTKYKDEKSWKRIKWKYYWGCFWRAWVKIIIIIAPISIYVLLRFIK